MASFHDDDFDDAIADGGTGGGLNVQRLIKLRGRIMVLVFLLLAVPSSVLIWLFVPREYVASADIEFQASAPSILMGQRGSISGTAAYETFVNTQINLITGYTILSRVLKQEEIQGIPYFQDNPNEAMAHLMAHVEALQEPQTELVTFSYRDEDPDTARLVLDVILRTYRAYVAEQEAKQGEQRQQILRERELTLAKNLEELRNEIARKRQEWGIPITALPGIDPKGQDANRIGLSQAEADVSGAESRVRQTERLLERLESLRTGFEANPSKPIFALGIEEKVLADANVIELIEQLATVQQEYSRLEETYVATAPQVKVKQQELSALEQKLDKVKADARRAALGSLQGQYEYELGNHQSELEDASERRDRFTRLIETEQEGNASRAGQMLEVEMMEKRAEDMRIDLRQIRETINEIDIESNAPGRANIVSDATVSNSADYTTRIKFLLVAIFGAAAIAMLLGLGMELLDQNIRSAEDVGYVTNLPVLSSILDTAEDRLPQDANVSRVTEQYPDSMIADEYRRTVGRILGARGRKKVRTCMVASPSLNDGKTTLACNLAIVLAQAGRKVLLLDVDARTPDVEACFGLPQGPGLAEILMGEAVPHDPSRKSPYPNLHIMGPGLRSIHLLERLASREMEDFMAGASEVFDHIIVDSPASLLMSEAKLLAPLVDGIVLVVGAGTSSFGMLRRALRIMRESEGTLLGIVVNAVRHSPGGYVRHNVDMYYAQERHPKAPARGVAS
jgi:capsular exopolysaccharide synthesis family protein